MGKLVTVGVLFLLGSMAQAPTVDARGTLPRAPLQMAHHRASLGETGLASWYGTDLQGRRTASGALFDKNKLTAAHRKLAFGTTVRVTNLKTRQSTLLKINDRGPAIPGRVIDVSWEAARELGFVEAGLARVRIEVVSSPPAEIWEPAS
jgi:rare lipoprotein A